MTVAVVDIGTNTVLLLVARLDEEGRVTPLVYEQRVPRLGKRVDATGRLAPDAMERVAAVLREYRSVAESLRPDAVVVCGTSAVRDASNRDEFAGLILTETGWRLEVLSGSEEALWTYRGAISGLEDITRATVLDIGGGSTELSTGDRIRPVAGVSINIGSVRLTERVLHHDPPLAAEIEDARTAVRTALGPTKDFSLHGSQLVGVAGTATALAILAQGLPRFSLEAVSGYRLTRSRAGDLLRRLSTMRVQQIRAMSDVMEGRADVITAGALILDEVFEMHGFPDLVVSERGVRYGLAIREWERRRPAH